MAEQHPTESSSASNASGEGSDPMVELNIKTLESQIYNFKVDKNMPVSLFKEKIANEIGVPVAQQRLIFRGKVLKDDHLLSEYHVENGHTLHLVARQPAQSQPSSDIGSGETSGNSNQGNEATAGAFHNRVGQISHSVLLGSFNVGDQGEGIVPDLTRVIGAVLNSFGVGGQIPVSSTSGTPSSAVRNVPGQAPPGNERQGRGGNQSQSGQTNTSQPFQPSPQAVHIPVAAGAVPIPSLHAPIPDSLNTLAEFMNCMEQTLSQNGYHPSSSSTSVRDLPRVELSPSGQGLPTPEALSIVLRHAQQLLSNHASAALAHIAGRLEQEGASFDPIVRGQIQTESVQVGMAMQHLGALFLELGRAILTLRMGQSPAESSVNAGPAVYISPSGPNPIMVQPFPLQTSSLFGGSTPTSNSTSFAPVGIGHTPRHINIHIHAGTSLAPVVSAVGSRAGTGEGTLGERSNDSGSVRMAPLRNVIAAAVPRSGVAISTATPPGLGPHISQRSSDPVTLSSVLADVTSQLRNIIGDVQGNNQVSSGQVGTTAEDSFVQSGAGTNVGSGRLNSMELNRTGESRVPAPGIMPESACEKSEDTGSSKNTSTSSSASSLGSSSSESSVKSGEGSENALSEGTKSVPLGLGLGSLERKSRSRQPKSPAKIGDGGTSSLDRTSNTRTSGQQLLQSLASRGLAMNRAAANNSTSGQRPPLLERTTNSGPSGQPGSDGQIDAASAMSQVLQNPALNGLLAGFSEQAGVGSPDVLRSMLQQFTQNPQIMNTVGQIAQQVDSQHLGDMFSGVGGGQGSGIDLSRMVQQMMPVVSRALSRGATGSQSLPSMETGLEQQDYGRSSSGTVRSDDQNLQIDVQHVAQRIEHHDTPGNIFRAIVENATRQGNGSSAEDLVDELCRNENLANEYTELLQCDIRRRLQGDSGEDKS